MAPRTRPGRNRRMSVFLYKGRDWSLEESRAKDLLHSLASRFGLPRER